MLQLTPQTRIFLAPSYGRAARLFAIRCGRMTEKMVFVVCGYRTDNA
jgi:hypothetical protein